jgi:hypothetical protein
MLIPPASAGKLTANYVKEEILLRKVAHFGESKPHL